MLVRHIYEKIVSSLLPKYNERDVSQLSYIILDELYGVTRSNYIIKKDTDVEYDTIKINSIISRLLKDEPIQYVLGRELFYDRYFKVTQDVLIPRPETWELVNIIIKENRDNNNLSILDIGTGSGAIAITLYMELKNSNVTAVDISPKALAIAKDNNVLHSSNVCFLEKDILSTISMKEKYDIIVSNPPYVTQSEKKYMQPNVLDFEPHKALFVEDSSPLIFYISIINIAVKDLNVGGKLYFEINEKYGDDIVQEMTKAGFSNVVLIEDFRDKPRFVKGELL